MHRFLIRFVALLLVSCLIADPVTASALTFDSRVTGQFIVKKTLPTVFGEEALGRALDWTRYDLFSSARHAFQIRRELRDADPIHQRSIYFPEPILFRNHPWLRLKADRLLNQPLTMLDRYPRMYDEFRLQVLPSIVHRHQSMNGHLSRTLKFLVLASATGEEVATVLAAVAGGFDAHPEWGPSNQWTIRVIGVERDKQAAAESLERLAGRSPFISGMSVAGRGDVHRQRIGELMATLNRHHVWVASAWDVRELDMLDPETSLHYDGADAIFVNVNQPLQSGHPDALDLRVALGAWANSAFILSTERSMEDPLSLTYDITEYSSTLLETMKQAGSFFIAKPRWAILPAPVADQVPPVRRVERFAEIDTALMFIQQYVWSAFHLQLTGKDELAIVPYLNSRGELKDLQDALDQMDLFKLDPQPQKQESMVRALLAARWGTAEGLWLGSTLIAFLASPRSFVESMFYAQDLSRQSQRMSYEQAETFLSGVKSQYEHILQGLHTPGVPPAAGALLWPSRFERRHYSGKRSDDPFEDDSTSAATRKMTGNYVHYAMLASGKESSEAFQHLGRWLQHNGRLAWGEGKFMAEMKTSRYAENKIEIVPLPTEGQDFRRLRTNAGNGKPGPGALGHVQIGLYEVQGNRIVVIKEIQPGTKYRHVVRGIEDPDTLDQWRKNAIERIAEWGASEGMQVYAATKEVMQGLYELKETSLQKNYVDPIDPRKWILDYSVLIQSHPNDPPGPWYKWTLERVPAAEQTIAFHGVAYHGTTQSAAVAIRREGFRLGRQTPSRRWAGDGVYLDSSLGVAGAVASERAQQRGELPAILKIEAHLGRPLRAASRDEIQAKIANMAGGSDVERKRNFQKQLLECGYDSVLIERSDGEEVVSLIPDKQLHILSDATSAAPTEGTAINTDEENQLAHYLRQNSMFGNQSDSDRHTKEGGARLPVVAPLLGSDRVQLSMSLVAPLKNARFTTLDKTLEDEESSHARLQHQYEQASPWEKSNLEAWVGAGELILPPLRTFHKTSRSMTTDHLEAWLNTLFREVTGQPQVKPIVFEQTDPNDYVELSLYYDWLAIALWDRGVAVDVAPDGSHLLYRDAKGIDPLDHAMWNTVRPMIIDWMFDGKAQQVIKQIIESINLEDPREATSDFNFLMNLVLMIDPRFPTHKNEIRAVLEAMNADPRLNQGPLQSEIKNAIARLGPGANAVAPKGPGAVSLLHDKFEDWFGGIGGAVADVLLSPLWETAVFFTLAFTVGVGWVGILPAAFTSGILFLILHPILHRMFRGEWESWGAILGRAPPIAVLYFFYGATLHLPHSSHPQLRAFVGTTFLHGLYNRLALALDWPLLSVNPLSATIGSPALRALRAAA